MLHKNKYISKEIHSTRATSVSTEVYEVKLHGDTGDITSFYVIKLMTKFTIAQFY
jgi:sporulation protein YlmC with PRC-barrel domain